MHRNKKRHICSLKLNLEAHINESLEKMYFTNLKFVIK